MQFTKGGKPIPQEIMNSTKPSVSIWNEFCYHCHESININGNIDFISSIIPLLIQNLLIYVLYVT